MTAKQRPGVRERASSQGIVFEDRSGAHRAASRSDVDRPYDVLPLDAPVIELVDRKRTRLAEGTNVRDSRPQLEPASRSRPGDTPWHEVTPRNRTRAQSEARFTPSPEIDRAWQDYERIGLAPKKSSTAAAKLIVSAYRLVGFTILTVIVAVLVGYIVTTAFYFGSHTWITPTVVSASDEKVVTAQAELAAQQNVRDQLAGELQDAETAIHAEQAFQAEFAKAIQTDLAGRRAALDRVRALADQAAATRAHIRSSNDEFAASSADRMSKEYQAGLIDRHDMLTGKYQLAQIDGANLSLAERQADYETQAQDLAVATRSLDALLSRKDTTAALSYDVLKIKRDYDASKLAVARAERDRTRLVASLAREDKIIDGIRSSVYLRALADHAVVALVPYDNLPHTAPGTTLYACKVEMVWCHPVGTVLEVLPGEVEFHNPHRDAEVRGQMVELKLTDQAAGKDDVLFAGGAPMGV